jgi:ketosteroid isomerase-like protein
MSNDADREVLAAEEARCKATREGDLAALERVLHEGYTHVTGTGKVMNRQQYLEWVSSTPRRHERHALQVRCFGDNAVIVGGLTNYLTEADGGTRVIEATVTQVARREQGNWRFVAFQITPKRAQ